MTIQQARRLSIGDAVTFKGAVQGVVTWIAFNSATIQWNGGPVLAVPHDQMANIERKD